MDWFNIVLYTFAGVGAIVIGVLICVWVTYIFETRAKRIRDIEEYGAWLREQEKSMSNLRVRVAELEKLRNQVHGLELAVKRKRRSR